MKSPGGEFDELWRNAQRELCGVARSITRNSADGDDLLQETGIRAFTYFHTYKPEGKFTAWCVRIMQRLWRSQLQIKKTLPRTLTGCHGGEGTDGEELDMQWLDTRTMAGAADCIQSRIERDEMIDEALAGVEPMIAHSVVLKELGGYTLAEAAKIMQCPHQRLRSVRDARYPKRKCRSKNVPQGEQAA